MDIFFVIGASGFIGQAVKKLLLQRPGIQSRFPSRESALDDLGTTINKYPSHRLSVLDLAWPGLRKMTSTSSAGIGDDDRDWLGYLCWLKKLMQIAKSHRGLRYFGVGSGIERY